MELLGFQRPSNWPFGIRDNFNLLLFLGGHSMRVNHTNPNIQLQNMMGLEQAARKEAQQKAAESAKAREAEETIRLQGIADSLKKIGDGKKKNQDGPQKQARRNARYLPDGTVQPEGTDSSPEDPSTPPPPRGGIDIRA